MPDSDCVETRALMERGELKTTSIGDNYRNFIGNDKFYKRNEYRGTDNN